MTSITVGATDNQDRRWANSGHGPEIDLIAPGVAVVGLHNNGTLYLDATGTSASAPMVSGVAALLASIRPNLNQEEARTLLCAGADDRVGDPSQDTPGFDEYYGWGRLNAYNSLILAQTRIQGLQFTNGNQMTFTWASPPNGSSKRPFRVEFASTPAGPWARLNSSSNITYTATLARWVDNGAETAAYTNRFYRLRVVAE